MPVSEDCREGRHDWAQSSLDAYYRPGEARPPVETEQIVDVKKCSGCGMWQVTWDPSR